MSFIIRDRIALALNKPLLLLCATGNPKSERMMYVNYIRRNHINEFITILYRQESNRLIIGPKDFNLMIFVSGYDTISQAELDIAWEKRTEEIPIARKSEMEIEASKPRVSQDDILTSLGFGGKPKI